MSIVGAAGPEEWAWAVWAIVAVVAGIAAWRRDLTPAIRAGASINTDAENRPHAVLDYATPDTGRRFLPLLALAGGASFVAWVATQMVYFGIHPASLTGGKNGSPSPADLASLSLLSALIAWCVGIGLMACGRGIETIGFDRKRVRRGGVVGLFGIFIALPIVYFALELTMYAWTRLGVHHPAKHELLEVMEHHPAAWVRIAAVASAAIAAPLFEEFLFRGCIQGGLRRATGVPWVGVLVASILFTSIHPAWTMPPIFIFSVLLGIVYERSGNLWASTTMHALFNLFAILTSGMG